MNVENPSELIPYLLSRRVIEAGDVPRITPLAGGVSSRTVLVEPSERPPFVLKQALEKLRVASDWFSSPSRIHREAEGMRFLRHLAPAGTITEFHFEDFSEHILAMSMVPRPHRTWKELLLAKPPVPRHFEQFAAILARIHVRSYRDQGLAQIFDDRTGFESLRLEPYYRYSAARVPIAKPFLENLIAETLGQRLTLVHGDYGPKNILVHEGRFVLVDHEVIHFGDPAFDLGFSLTHLLAKAMHLEQFRRELLESADLYIRRYLGHIRGTGFDKDFEARACRHTAACLLSRVEGRSPFEYLSDVERDAQRSAAFQLMANIPENLSDLIFRFEEVVACPGLSN